MSVKLVYTEEQVNLLKSKMQEHLKKPGPLMPTLHDAQDIFGCIPLEIQEIIAKELNESIAKINGVVTFYSHFTLEPKGKHVIAVCLGTACYVRGSQAIIDEFKKQLHINSNQTSEDGNYTLMETRCIGACGLAPVFTVDGVVYGNATPKKAHEALDDIA
ncbi:MAG: NAD(P)H-dependent oxidoreductase subunit E [Bacilli bacterium]